MSLPIRNTEWYGWRPDMPDQRDHLYTSEYAAVPTKSDLRSLCPPVYDQGQLGSCTANAIGGAIQFDRMKQKLTPNFVPSRLFIYYNERVMENSVSQDAGAEIRDGIKSVAKLGVCPETDWKYDIAAFAKKPPTKAFADALKHKEVSYKRITDITQMKTCLGSGLPFVFGFSVYESFESATVEKTGVLNMPKKSEQLLGGHAVMAVGHDDAAKRFIVRNSWGADWGQKGYFTIPYDYLMDDNLSSDFWQVTTVSG